MFKAGGKAMRFKALKTFTGKISMYQGEERTILDQKLIDDLLNAHYIEQAVEKKAERKVTKKKTPKGG